MAWSTPRVWASGEVLTAANFNTYISDDLTFLGTHTHTGAAGAGSATVSFTTHDVDVTFQSGVRIGTNAASKEIDDATQGASSDTLYIGNASITVASDRRFKRNIRKWAVDAQALIRTFKVVEYDQDEERPFGNKRHYVGLTAQDVYKIAPWVVNTQGGSRCAPCRAGRKCDKHKGWHIRYELLVPVLILALQQFMPDKATKVASAR